MPLCLVRIPGDSGAVSISVPACTSAHILGSESRSFTSVVLVTDSPRLQWLLSSNKVGKAIWRLHSRENWRKLLGLQTALGNTFTLADVQTGISLKMFYLLKAENHAAILFRVVKLILKASVRMKSLGMRNCLT